MLRAVVGAMWALKHFSTSVLVVGAQVVASQQCFLPEVGRGCFQFQCAACHCLQVLVLAPNPAILTWGIGQRVYAARLSAGWEL